MKIMAVDDEKLVLEGIVNDLTELTGLEIASFTFGQDAIDYASVNHIDVAFLDINMRRMTGLELAEKLKEYNPRVNIVFVTGYLEYSKDAFDIHASGYVSKPTTKEKLKKELDNLRYPIVVEPLKKLKVSTFGNFEVFCNGSAVQFGRGKAKELFAVLVHKAGTSVSMGELATYLWEDDKPTYMDGLRVIIHDLRKTLRSLGCEDIILKQKNSIRLDSDKVDCDLYRLIDGDDNATKLYMGQYMHCYPWADEKIPYIEKLLQNIH